MDEPNSTDKDSTGESTGHVVLQRSRRRVLASIGAGIAGSTASAGLPGSAAAQEGPANVATTMVIEPGEEFGGNLMGQFAVVVSHQREADSVPGFGSCEGVDWEVSETVTHEGLLVDRLRQDPRGVERTFYVDPTGDPVAPGTTFVINEVTNCDQFAVIEVEAVGAAQFPEGTQTGETPDGDGAGGDGSIPGFTGGGALAALASLLGFGALRRLRDGEDD